MPIARSLRTAALALGTLLSGCGHGGDHGSYSVRDSAGVKIATNGDVGAWTPDQVWHFQEDLRIASSDTDPHRRFTAVLGLGVTSGGDILLLEPEPQLEEFDAAGRYLRTIGRPGQGPGEFGNGPLFLVMTPGDSAVVIDFGNQRGTVFTPDGHPARTFAAPASGPQSIRWDYLPGTGLLEETRSIILPHQHDVKPVDNLLVIGDTGAPRDTLLHLPLGQILDMSGGVATVKTPYFEPDVEWDATDDGRVLAGKTDQMRISAYDRSGRLKMIVSKSSPAVPVTEADRDAVRARFRRELERQAASTHNTELPGMIEPMIKNMEFGSVYPAYSGLLGGPDSTILVQRTVTVSEAAKAADTSGTASGNPLEPQWDVFDASGRYQGVIRLPAGFRLKAVLGDRFYGVVYDSLNVPSVVRLKRVVGRQ